MAIFAAIGVLGLDAVGVNAEHGGYLSLVIGQRTNDKGQGTNLAYIYGRTFSIIQIICQVGLGVKGFWENFWVQETGFLRIFPVINRDLVKKPGF